MSDTKEKWLKASVIGSLWASIEIILGSFFHNLQLPIAGTLLAVFTVVFVISILQLWQVKGLVWRAGLISALMKSISPSAVILGPMTGIFMEAVLIELFIFIFGFNLFSYILAGISAVLSALIHKLVTLLLIYGWDSVKIFSNMYNYAAKQLHFTNTKAIDAFYWLIAVYMILGFLASIFGYFIGQKAKTKNKKSDLEINGELKSDFLALNSNQKFSVYFLFVNLIIVFASLYVIQKFGLLWGSIVVVADFLFNSFRYKNAFRQFKRPMLWLQLLSLLLLSSVFYFENGQAVFFTLKGLQVGVEMILRAVVVILGFSAISVELRNPIIKTVLYNKGFAALYDSLGLAFLALPAIISEISKPKDMLKKPFNTILNILLYTDILYKYFENNEQVNNNNSR